MEACKLTPKGVLGIVPAPHPAGLNLDRLKAWEVAATRKTESLSDRQAGLVCGDGGVTASCVKAVICPCFYPWASPILLRMEPQLIMDVVKQALLMVVTLSLPILIVGLGVGLVIALFQALTQIQEMSLTFVPKIIAVFLALFVLTPVGMAHLSEFMRLLADLMIGGERVQ